MGTRLLCVAPRGICDIGPSVRKEMRVGLFLSFTLCVVWNAKQPILPISAECSLCMPKNPFLHIEERQIINACSIDLQHHFPSPSQVSEHLLTDCCLCRLISEV